MFPERSPVEELRDAYPPGTRIQLVSMNDPQAPIPGSLGTVRCVDDIGTIHVSWDSGSGLGLIVGEDRFEKLSPS